MRNKPKLIVRGIDMFALFVAGLTFLIACFNPKLAIAYLIYLGLGAFLLAWINYLNSKTGGKNDKY